MKTVVFCTLLLLVGPTLVGNDITFHIVGQSVVDLARESGSGQRAPNDFSATVHYWDDSTIVLKAEALARIWRPENDDVWFGPSIDFLALDTRAPQRPHWFIKDRVDLQRFFDIGVAGSPDRRFLVYTSGQCGIEQYCLASGSKEAIPIPDGVCVDKLAWSPAGRYIWLTCSILLPERSASDQGIWERETFEECELSLYDTVNGSIIRTFEHHRIPDALARTESVWQADGKAVYVTHGDSGLVRKENARFTTVVRYDVERNEMRKLYRGEILDNMWLATDVPALDTSLVFFYRAWSDERARLDALGIKSFDPTRGTLRTLWSIEGGNGPQEIPGLVLSSDRQYVAYYTPGTFHLERLELQGREEVYACPVGEARHYFSAGFSPDCRKVCFVRSFPKPGQVEVVWGELSK